MPRAGKAALRFVRALLAGAIGTRDGDAFAAGDIRLEVGLVHELVTAGVLAGDAETCRPLAETLQWLKRQLLDEDAFAAQHRVMVADRDGTAHNLAESALARLAVGSGEDAPFLKPHHVEAGQRVGRLVERAQLQPRLTMSYSPAHTASGNRDRVGDLGGMAADARKALAELHRQLPRDCADVILDICGFGKGLQQVESERGWPRRSAKLVLRIGLDRLAEIYGLGEVANGPEVGRRRGWMGVARPTEFG